tara:strand:- start:640 stop:870 length:231 start_codon:yes stop_codon:yes gene_type:complete
MSELNVNFELLPRQYTFLNKLMEKRLQQDEREAEKAKKNLAILEQKNFFRKTRRKNSFRKINKKESFFQSNSRRSY